MQPPLKRPIAGPNPASLATYKNTMLLCKNCGKILRKRSSKVYCSNSCQQEFQWANRPLSNCRDPRAIRQYLIRTRGHQCEECQYSRWTKDRLIPLEVDHVDGNHTNNTEENLKLLCPNCHALTPTFKARNKGNGRKHRRASVA